MFYQLPESLQPEIDALEKLIVDFRSGTIDASTLKAHRVPFGIYEQRTNGIYMARVRCPGGMITPDQLTGVARLSDKYGNGEIHITTRQELQIHGLLVDRLIPLQRDLLKEGLSTRGGGGNTVRNVIVSPESGIDPDEVFDVSPHACALTTRLIADPGSWFLPRKFKIAFSCCARDSGYARFNDVGFIARIRDGVRGFRVYVAGGMGSKPEVGHLLEDFIPERQVFAVAEAVKRVFSRHGNRKNRHAARLRFLWRELGEERFRSLYQAEMAELQDCELPKSELEVQPVARVDAVPHIEPIAKGADCALWKSRFVAEQKQDGLFSVLIPVLFGNVSTSSIVALAEFLHRLGPDVVRLTIGQNLQLRNIPEQSLVGTFEVVRGLFELSTAARFLGDAIACTGADTCKLGICLPRGALQAVQERLRRSNLDLDRLAGCRLNLSGCPNSCGQHPLADLGFYGRAGRNNEVLYPEYNVVAGAVVGEHAPQFAEALGRVSARDLPEFVHELIVRFLSGQPRFESFRHYLQTEGKQDIRALCEQFRKIPDFEADQNYYYDWGAKAQFRLEGKGGGECAAGLLWIPEK
ncbi:MAG: nitrite/sulfite reductase [Acidobacteria bacterium]|nr:MAG: nitrite/sulfite reductase [Acidobacteriota bacterium]